MVEAWSGTALHSIGEFTKSNGDLAGKDTRRAGFQSIGIPILPVQVLQGDGDDCDQDLQDHNGPTAGTGSNGTIPPGED